MKNFKSLILIITVLLSFSFTRNEPVVKKVKVNESIIKEKINSTDYVMITVVFKTGTTESQIQNYRNSFSRSFNIVSYKSCTGVLSTETWLISAESYTVIDSGSDSENTVGGGEIDDPALQMVNSKPSFIVRIIVDLNVSINGYNNATCIASGL
tara:strand:- start:3003 stop:3464 length:462 start_codon:yes stop_codon:yes gene_type:complete